MINQLSRSICYLLMQLENALAALSDEQFCQPIPLLGQASIGQHMRHILEFYIELGNGYQTGMIDYDKRKRDHKLETFRQVAIQEIQQISSSMELENKELNIMAQYGSEGQTKQQLPTNYYRELMYNLEHTVHHMALIRVGFCLLTKISLPDDFGIAASTLKYRKTCAR